MLNLPNFFLRLVHWICHNFSSTTLCKAKGILLHCKLAETTMNNNNSNVPKDPRGAASSPTMDMVLNGAGRNSFDPQENPTTPSMKQTRDGSSNEPSPTSVILDDGTHQLFTEGMLVESLILAGCLSTILDFQLSSLLTIP